MEPWRLTPSRIKRVTCCRRAEKNSVDHNLVDAGVDAGNCQVERSCLRFQPHRCTSAGVVKPFRHQIAQSATRLLKSAPSSHRHNGQLYSFAFSFCFRGQVNAFSVPAIHFIRRLVFSTGGRAGSCSDHGALSDAFESNESTHANIYRNSYDLLVVAPMNEPMSVKSELEDICIFSIIVGPHLAFWTSAGSRSSYRHQILSRYEVRPKSAPTPSTLRTL